MINSELEKIIYLIGNTLIDNITFHNFAAEEARKLEHSNGFGSAFTFILTRLAKNEREIHRKEFYRGNSQEIEMQINKADIIGSLETINKINLRERTNKEQLERLIKSVSKEYDVNLFITILETIGTKFFDILKENKIEFITKKELIEEDTLIETIKSVMIIENLYKKDFPYFEQLLKYIWSEQFPPVAEKVDYLELHRDINIVFIDGLNRVTNLCKKILKKGNISEKLIINLQEIENERITETYFFAFKTILKNFPSIKVYASKYLDQQPYSLYLYEQELVTKRCELVANTEELHSTSGYATAINDFVRLLQCKEKLCYESNYIINTLISKIEIINKYLDENPNLPISNDLLKGIMFNSYNTDTYINLASAISSFNYILNILKQKKHLNTAVLQNEVTKEEVKEAIKFIVNNYMSDEIFYMKLIEFRESNYQYGLNISRFCLALMQVYKTLELDDIKEETSKKELKKLYNKI